MKKNRVFIRLTIVQASLLSLILSAAVAAQTAPPPAFGEETKGDPAVPELSTEDTTKADETDAESEETTTQQSFTNNLLGEATITEQRRENGQIYRIELEHSSGSKQYIEENDSDGQLSSDDINLEDTPNLPKWKLGSW